MYAVFVLAALLLSLAPMHAQTLLAVLPATLPSQLQAEPANELSLVSPSVLVAVPRHASAPPTILRSRIPLPAARPVLRLAAAQAAPLAHAPNAP